MDSRVNLSSDESKTEEMFDKTKSDFMQDITINTEQM